MATIARSNLRTPLLFKSLVASFAVLLSTVLQVPASAHAVDCTFFQLGFQRCVAAISKQSFDEIAGSNPQERSLWCWAASLSAIFGLASHPTSQESIVRQTFGRLDNLPGGPFLQFEKRLNRRWRDDNGAYFRSSSRRIDTVRDSVRALDAGIPLLYTTANHAVVMTSVTFLQSAVGEMRFAGGTIFDPLPGVGLRNVQQSDVATYIQAWRVSIVDVPSPSTTEEPAERSTGNGPTHRSPSSTADTTAPEGVILPDVQHAFQEVVPMAAAGFTDLTVAATGETAYGDTASAVEDSRTSVFGNCKLTVRGTGTARTPLTCKRTYESEESVSSAFRDFVASIKGALGSSYSYKVTPSYIVPGQPGRWELIVVFRPGETVPFLSLHLHSTSDSHDLLLYLRT